MKRIILCLVIIIGALTITGCGNKVTVKVDKNKNISLVEIP